MWKRAISYTFLARGFDISGMDLSEEMLAKLKQKAPDEFDILHYGAIAQLKKY